MKKCRKFFFWGIKCEKKIWVWNFVVGNKFNDMYVYWKMFDLENKYKVIDFFNFVKIYIIIF